MTEEISVSVCDVTKKYRLFSTPGERVKESFHPFRKRYHKEFWALKGISFNIVKGQVLGILGRNGSGKSTLLQIIASVVRPTSGSVTVNGRVSALLELGLGFNPEFTARQNVMLNGAIMGVSRAEMLRRMPGIMAFADIGEFFDQPMKIYSSGMLLRVAFAAAIHVDPDIFIVDEALAVGDAKFQHKCFQRLTDLQAQRRTVILVTHNSSLVTNYCDRALLLDQGRLVADGEPTHVVDRYYDLLFDHNTASAEALLLDDPDSVNKALGENHVGLNILDDASNSDICHTRQSYNKNEVRFGNGAARIIDYTIQSEDMCDTSNIRFGSRVTLYLKVLFCRNVDDPIVGFSVKTVEGVEIFGTNTFLMGKKIDQAIQETIRVFSFGFFLRINPSDYFFDLGVAEADGTRGGTVLDVRRSVAHCIVTVEKQRSFEGLVDLMPSFEVLSKQARVVFCDHANAEAGKS